MLPAVTPRERIDIPGIDDQMGFAPPLVPLCDIRENIAEKLSRMRHKKLARDFYDLALLGPRDDDLPAIRRLTAFKTFFDAHEGINVRPPFLGGADFVGIDAADVIGVNDIGRLGGRAMPVEEMCTKVGAFYGRMGNLVGPIEERLARCGARDKHWAEALTWDEGLT